MKKILLLTISITMRFNIKNKDINMFLTVYKLTTLKYNSKLKKGKNRANAIKKN